MAPTRQTEDMTEKYNKSTYWNNYKDKLHR